MNFGQIQNSLIHLNKPPNLLRMKESALIELFNKLYFSKSEDDIEKIIIQHSEIFDSSNWTPLGQNYSNYGVIENQQSSPIAALIEKITILDDISNTV